jgi:hypothetical protein
MPLLLCGVACLLLCCTLPCALPSNSPRFTAELPSAAALPAPGSGLRLRLTALPAPGLKLLGEPLREPAAPRPPHVLLPNTDEQPPDVAIELFVPPSGEGLRERICCSASSCCFSSACCSASFRWTASCFSSCCCCRLCRSWICCSRLAHGVTFGRDEDEGRCPLLPRLCGELLLAAVLRPPRVATGLPLRSCCWLQVNALLPGAPYAVLVGPKEPNAAAGGGAKSAGYFVALPASPSSDSRVLSATKEH